MRDVIPAVLALAFFSNAQAQNTPIPPFPIDTPMRMRAVEAVCTGVSSDARDDPRWAAYAVKVEVVDPAGHYLSDAQVTISKADEAVAAVNCRGPWVLFNVPPGAYSVTAEFGGMSKSGRINVAGTGQARLVLRFP